MKINDDKTPYIPVVLTEKQAEALVRAAQATIMSATVLAKTPEEKAALPPLAGGMLRLAEAVDKAREKRSSES